MISKKIAIILTCACFACTSGSETRLESKDLNFSTTDASELFFKNIRKSEYRQQNMPGATLDIYRHAKWEGSAPIAPAIVINWGNDQAFLLLEKVDDQPDQLMLLIRADDQTDTLSFHGNHQREHAEVALQLFNALLDEKNIYVLDPAGKITPLYSDSEEKIFKKVMADFLRLVELV